MSRNFMENIIFSFQNRRIAVLERSNLELSQWLRYLGQWIFKILNYSHDVEPNVMNELAEVKNRRLEKEEE
jgi:hypothetical protein